MRKGFWFFSFSVLLILMLFVPETKADVYPAFWGEAVENNCYLDIEVERSNVIVHQKVEMKLQKMLSDDYIYAFSTISANGKFNENSLSIITPPFGVKDSAFDHGCKLDYLSGAGLEDTLKVAFEYEYEYPHQDVGKILYKRRIATARHGYVVGVIVDTNQCIDIVCNQEMELQQRRHSSSKWTTVGKGTHIVYHPYRSGVWNPTLKIILSASGKIDTLEEVTYFDVVPEHHQYIPNLIENEFITVEFTESNEDVFDYRLYGTIELDVEAADLFDPFYAWFPNDQTEAQVKLEGIYEHCYGGECTLRHTTYALQIEPTVLGEQKGFYILIPELSDSSEYYVKRCKKATLRIEIDGVQSERSCDFILVTAPQEYSSVKFKIPERFSFGHCFSPFEHDITYRDQEFEVKKFYGRCPSTGIAHVEWSTSPSPENLSLFQNYPNPFNQETLIKYTLPWDCAVKLSVYNLLGERVKTLVDEPQNADDYEARWDGRDNQGKKVASGIYFYRVQAGKFTQTNKMLLLK